jgi:regulator of replication initiation timing
MECTYCKNKFSSKYVLISHQKSARYCLKIQNKKPDEEYKCEGCSKTFTTVYDLNIHRKKCKSNEMFYEFQGKLDRKDEEINKKDEGINKLRQECSDYKSRYQEVVDENVSLKLEHKRQIELLQDKLENVALQMARRPTQQNTYNNRTQINTPTQQNTYNNRTQINTIIQKMDMLTDSHMKEQSSNLTIEHLRKGVKGYVEYAMNYPLKNRVLCVDYARRKIKYKDEEGKTITDPEMTRLSQKFFESIRDKNKVLAIECVEQLSDDMDIVEKMQIMTDMSQLMVDVNNSASGDKNDFTHDFVKGVCSESVR